MFSVPRFAQPFKNILIYHYSQNIQKFYKNISALLPVIFKESLTSHLHIKTAENVQSADVTIRAPFPCFHVCDLHTQFTVRIDQPEKGWKA